ncbi:molybdenum cofactor guanylyltransferase MobA [Amylibacter sp. IMCC11727]|uniref:molybdenum cofactor guanylyltransferase MobA n=1 Tax=Amylibacter sp. IMCC11727 TaxID=3039851 RepID=UPI00244E4178|nr:molybdenum cofactor guanylyltransferase MobA [Amylibacter sp. IMCC11727]WGI21658.1 molybdenum cofactor guanylyltransferase MobA [Amylibacter sp. IMCC11727]
MVDAIGVILAGGLSSRMGGGDKGLLTLGGVSLLGRVKVRLGKQISPVILNANGDPSRFEGLGVPVVNDTIAGFAGPLAGVLAGMDYAASQGATHIVTVAADTPFFPVDFVARLDATGADLAMAVTPDPERGQARHPTFGKWPVALRDDLRGALNDGVRKVVQWTKPHGCVNVEFDAEPFDPFFNVNTPDDMARAEQMIAEFEL